MHVRIEVSTQPTWWSKILNLSFTLLTCPVISTKAELKMVILIVQIAILLIFQNYPSNYIVQMSPQISGQEPMDQLSLL